MVHSTLRATRALAFATSVAIGVAGCQVIRPSGRTEHAAIASSGIIELNDNGGWSWFQDERAVVDATSDTILVSSVASSAGSDGATRQGNVELVSHHIPSGTNRRVVLHPNLQSDDHNSAALHVLPDGRYLAMYSMHATDTLSRWRITRRAGHAAVWEPERAVSHPEFTTYANVYAAPEERRLYAFVRAAGRDPTILSSTDDGATWTRRGLLLDGPGRPYVRYAADLAGRIHVLTTEQHPLDFANGVYHGIVERGQLQRSDGTIVDTNLFDDDAVGPSQLSTVFVPDGADRAWTIDLHVDVDGNPYAAFSVHDPPDTLSGEPAPT